MAISFKPKLLALVLLATMGPLSARADRLVADDATYSGRVISAKNSTLIFDFGCTGQIKTIELQQDWIIDISGDCSPIEPFGIGGSEVCTSGNLHDAMYLIQSLPNQGDQSFIFAFDFYSYQNGKFRVGIDGAEADIPPGIHTIKRIPGDFCKINFGNEFPE